jgi:Uroporphyrinogen-III decarboxylase
MEPRQRVLAALRREVPDRVPILDSVDEPALLSVAHLLDVGLPDLREPLAYSELACRLTLRLGLDGIGLEFPRGQQRIDDSLLVDRWGCTYRPSSHGTAVPLSGPIESLEDMRGFTMVDQIRSEDFAAIRFTRERLGSAYPVVVWFPDMFRVSWTLRGGMQKLLIDFVRSPDLAHSLARTATDWILGVIAGCQEAGADVLVLDGDIAEERDTLFSMAHFDSFLAPYYQEVVEAAHRRGLPILKHTDGNAWRFLDVLADIGFDGFNPIQPQCMDLAEVKEHIGSRMCLVGNIDCRDLLVFGSEEEVKRTVRETIQIAAPGGGFILHSSNSIHPKVRPENFVAMVEAGLEYGRYE